MALRHRARVSLLCIAVASAAVPLLTSNLAHADTEEALRHYQRGVELFGEGAYDAALVEFERAYATAPTYKLLFNIAQVNRQLNDYAKALEAYDRYLRDGGAEIPPARKAEVRAEMAKMSTRVARLDVKTNAPQGEISVDDAVVGNYPSNDPIIVNVGKRKVTLKDPTGQTQTKVIDVVAGETVKVDLSFAKAAPNPTPEVVEPPSFPVVPWVITGALVVGTTVTGIVALGKSNDAKNLEKTAPVSAYVTPGTPDDLNSRLASARDSAKTFGIITDVLLGCTVVSAGLSTYFTLKYMHGKESAVNVTPTVGGAVVTGRF